MRRNVEVWSQVYPGSNYSDAERVFLMAMDTYKRRYDRRFPTWREALAVLLSLGYRRVARPGRLPRPEEIGRPAKRR